MEAVLRIAFALCSGVVVGLVVYGAMPVAATPAGVVAGLVVAVLAVALPLVAAREEHSEPEIRHAPPGRPRRRVY
jgi:hypothetical protein